MLTIILLLASNIFMTFAWYGHLKYKSAPLWTVVLVSWGIAFFEYCLQVPANRWGHADPASPPPGSGGPLTASTIPWAGSFSAVQLKTIQEIITLVVFAAFSILYLKERLHWNHAVGFALLVAAAFFIFKKW